MRLKPKGHPHELLCANDISSECTTFSLVLNLVPQGMLNPLPTGTRVVETSLMNLSVLIWLWDRTLSSSLGMDAPGPAQCFEHHSGSSGPPYTEGGTTTTDTSACITSVDDHGMMAALGGETVHQSGPGVEGSTASPSPPTVPIRSGTYILLFQYRWILCFSSLGVVTSAHHLGLRSLPMYR